MNEMELEALAYDEAIRLLETEFGHYNPYTRIIEAEHIPFSDRDKFYQLVEDELALKGEKIRRNGPYFKIERYQAR